jgi:hypothetical protein
LALKFIASSAVKFWSEMAGVANRAAEWRIFKFITFSGEADWATMLLRI